MQAYVTLTRTTVSLAVLVAALSPAQGSSAPQTRLMAEQQPVADTLRAMGEPPIGQLPTGNQVFRFLWMRSFHRPILVQVEKRGKTAQVVVKALDSAWSASPKGVHVGALALAERKAITVVDWERLATMRRAAFWGQPSQDPRAEVGDDGATWVLEGTSWGEYHIVERWSPTEGSFRDLCISMLELAGINLLNERVLN